MSNQSENKTEQGGCLQVALALVAISIVVGMISTCFFGDEKEQEQTVQVFSFTVNEFVSRYNRSTQNIARNSQKHQIIEKLRRRIAVEEEREITDGVEHVLIQSGRGSNLHLSVTTNKNSSSVRSIYYMIYMPGNVNALMGDVLLGFSAIIMAVEDPDMSPEERGKRLKEIGTFKVVEDMKTIRTSKNKVDYKVEIIKALGAITLSVKPSLQ